MTSGPRKHEVWPLALADNIEDMTVGSGSLCLLSLLRFEAFTPIDFIALRNETRPTLHLRSTIRLVVSDLFPSEMPASLTKLCSFFFVAPRCAIVMALSFAAFFCVKASALLPNSWKMSGILPQTHEIRLI